MQKIIQAAFPSVDAAEYAASYLQQHIPHLAQVSITPRNPNSIAIGGIPQTYFQSIQRLLFLPTILLAELNGN